MLCYFRKLHFSTLSPPLPLHRLLFLYFVYSLIVLAQLCYFLVIALGSKRSVTNHQDINKQDDDVQ